MTTTTPPCPLTKREYFAALALQGYFAAHAQSVSTIPCASDLAKKCVGFANALAAELAATEPAAPAPTAPMTYGPPPPGYYESQESLRAALGAVWHTHNAGDPMPCGPSLRIQVKYRNGELSTPDRADYYLWSVTGEPYDIVAWRPAP
jgi:hypothetical protein